MVALAGFAETTPASVRGRRRSVFGARRRLTLSVLRAGAWTTGRRKGRVARTRLRLPVCSGRSRERSQVDVRDRQVVSSPHTRDRRPWIGRGSGRSTGASPAAAGGRQALLGGTADRCRSYRRLESSGGEWPAAGSSRLRRRRPGQVDDPPRARHDRSAQATSSLAPRSTSAISGRVNSAGSGSPRESSSRTLVPLRTERSELGCGQVRVEAMPPHARQ